MPDDTVKKRETERLTSLGRRDLVKLGFGAALGSLSAPALFAQGRGGGRRAAAPEGVPRISTHAGFKYTANRVNGNGPMDAISQQIASYTASFSEAQLTEPVVAGLNKLMIDCMVALIGSFGCEIGQICARLAKLSGPTELKSTVANWGITTEPVAAAFANCFLVRQADYNDGDPPHGGHASVIIPGVLAIGEAVHSTGTQVLEAVALGYEFLNAAHNVVRDRGGAGGGEGGGEGGEGGGVGWGDPAEGIATAIACGKLLGLNEDRLGNAISLALVPHLSLGKGDGTQSHFKAGHSAMNVRNGVFAALAAREGMTGPNAPFDGAEGLFEKVTGPFEIRLPVVPGHLGVENFRVKRYAAEGNAQAMLHQAIPPIRDFTKYQDIDTVHIEVDFGTLREIASPECWDPSNRETADHSLPYMFAAALMDGEVYLSSYTPQRYLHDTALKELMGRITVQANPDLVGTQGKSRIVVKKKSGESITRVVENEVPVTYEEVLKKFDRVCAYMNISNADRDRTKATWTNLRAVKDIAEPMVALGHLGTRSPLTGGTPKS
jgi:2-methylcitrate dehydratase